MNSKTMAKNSAMTDDVGGLPSVRLQYSNTTCAVLRGNGDISFCPGVVAQ